MNDQQMFEETVREQLQRMRKAWADFGAESGELPTAPGNWGSASAANWGPAAAANWGPASAANWGPASAANWGQPEQ